SCAGPDSVRWHRQEEGFLYVASKYVHLYALLCQAGLSGRPNSMLACKTVTEASSCLARAIVGLNQYRVWGSRDDSLGSFRSPKSTHRHTHTYTHTDTHTCPHSTLWCDLMAGQEKRR